MLRFLSLLLLTARLGSGHVLGCTAPSDGGRASLHSGELGRAATLLFVGCPLLNRSVPLSACRPSNYDPPCCGVNMSVFDGCSTIDNTKTETLAHQNISSYCAMGEIWACDFLCLLQQRLRVCACKPLPFVIWWRTLDEHNSCRVRHATALLCSLPTP